MRSISFYWIICLLILIHNTGICQPASTKLAVALFDGKSLTGWEGDTTVWHINNGAIAGGSLEKTVPHNFFLTTKKNYGNFILRLKFKLISNEGFMNAGVQFHSKRLSNPAYEMTGYQADLGPGYWASLYDESRRDTTLVKPDSLLIKKVLKPDDWNDYEIRASNNHIEIWLNGHQTVSYTEKNGSIPQKGLIGLQIHGGGKTLVSYKDIFIEELSQ